MTASELISALEQADKHLAIAEGLLKFATDNIPMNGDAEDAWAWTADHVRPSVKCAVRSLRDALPEYDPVKEHGTHDRIGTGCV